MLVEYCKRYAVTSYSCHDYIAGNSILAGTHFFGDFAICMGKLTTLPTICTARETEEATITNAYSNDWYTW